MESKTSLVQLSQYQAVKQNTANKEIAIYAATTLVSFFFLILLFQYGLKEYHNEILVYITNKSKSPNPATVIMFLLCYLPFKAFPYLALGLIPNLIASKTTNYIMKNQMKKTNWLEERFTGEIIKNVELTDDCLFLSLKPKIYDHNKNLDKTILEEIPEKTRKLIDNKIFHEKHALSLDNYEQETFELLEKSKNLLLDFLIEMNTSFVYKQEDKQIENKSKRKQLEAAAKTVHNLS